jgi:NADPH-dependent 2,4-dienoyl-CoA reductase/sulfur reductase-like enzyme
VTTHRYLVIGGGLAAHAAATAIRELDPDGSLAMIAAEPERPYARPPLTKGLWKGKPEDSVFYPPVPGLVLLAGRRAVALDTRARTVHDGAGGEHRYERLLLATGATPRRLPFGGDRVIYYRTLDDYRRIRAVAGDRFVVIGAGFIGSEIAASLASNGKRVTMVFPEEAIGSRAYPRDLAAYVTRYYEERGVVVRRGEGVAAIEGRGDETVVRTTGGAELASDAVIAGLGVRPDTALAEAAGIRCDDGVLVDERLETSAPDVYAAGDVARFPSEALGELIRVEHEDAALTMGRTAGQVMAGADVRYRHLPFFYSDLFDLGYEAVGRLDPRLEVVTTWKTPFREGVVYYLDRGRVRGVLLWGVFGQVDAARELIERGSAVAPEALQGAIGV